MKAKHAMKYAYDVLVCIVDKSFMYGVPHLIVRVHILCWYSLKP